MIFKEPPLFDYGKQSKRSLAMQLANGLKIHGLPAIIYRPQAIDPQAQIDPIPGNMPYADLYQPNSVASGTCLVLLGQPFEGLEMNDFISLSDKVHTQIHVTTNQELFINDQLTVTWPDQKTMNLRIIENWAFHAHTTEVYRYKAVVT